MLYGDAKTVENIMEFHCKVSGRDISLEQAYIYGEIFLEALFSGNDVAW